MREVGEGFVYFCCIFFFFLMVTASAEPTGRGKKAERWEREGDDGERGKMVSIMSGGRETGSKRGKGGRDGRIGERIEAERVSVCRSSPKQ